ncbi:MAG: HAMP domain-containing sensor histidine kinase [Pseudomonadota bacterium]
MFRGLSARLLLVTVVLVLIGEVLIYVPSISRFRMEYLKENLRAAHLAATATLAVEDMPIKPEVERELLAQAGLIAARVQNGDQVMMIGEPSRVDATYDLSSESIPSMVLNALRAMLRGDDRIIRVTGPSPHDPDVLVEIVVPERPLCIELTAYSGRILQLSLFLSALVAGCLFLWLRRLIVDPLERLTDNVMAFRENPEDPDAVAPATLRTDELGVVQRETARMQRRVRDALRQKERLAALGGAVGKINHDLRNVLASAILLSDRLEASADPQVKRVAPRLIAALERATALCAETLAFARSETPELRRERVTLAPFVAAAAEVAPGYGERWRLRNDVPMTATVHADPDQLHRAIGNVIANAAQAMAEAGGLIAVEAWREGGMVVLRFADTGPGIPEQIRPHLFEPFVGTSRADGTGLGLHNARDVARRHGGDLVLERTGPDGTTFRFLLPER